MSSESADASDSERLSPTVYGAFIHPDRATV